MKNDFKNIKGAIFDLDGTLLDTLPDLSKAFNEGGKQIGAEYKTIEDIIPHFGNGIKYLFTHLFPETMDDEEKYMKVYEAYRVKYAKCNCEDTKKFDEIEDLLSYLKGKGIKLAVLSNKQDVSVKKIINHYFKEGTFVSFYGQREGYKVKPDTTTLFDIINEMGLTKDEVVMIGDGKQDYNVSKNAGIKHIGCLWGYTSKKILEEIGVTTLVNRPSDIKELL